MEGSESDPQSCYLIRLSDSLASLRTPPSGTFCFSTVLLSGFVQLTCSAQLNIATELINWCPRRLASQIKDFVGIALS